MQIYICIDARNNVIPQNCLDTDLPPPSPSFSVLAGQEGIFANSAHSFLILQLGGESHAIMQISTKSFSITSSPPLSFSR